MIPDFQEAPGAPSTTAESPPPSWRSAQEAFQAGLVVAHSPDSEAVGRVIPLGATIVAVGRDVDGVGLSLRDPRLSRVHFRIGVDPRTGHHRLGDAHSRNGTLVEGARMDSAPLAPGTVIRAGESVFVYSHGDPLSRIEERVALIARSEIAVLIVGETGVGKERLARAVHRESGRSGPFVAVNCGALVRELLAAELFGHVRGAFSGAEGPRTGLFRSAKGGTLFLDEIGDMPLELQPVILRTLQEGTVRPLGTDEEIRVDVRVVAATSVQLEDAVRERRFRADLHARLARAVVELPPLRDRRASVLPLAHAIAASVGLTHFSLSANAAEALVRYGWPYNVRELESLVQAFAAERTSSPLDMRYLNDRYPRMCESFRSVRSDTEGPSIPPPANQRATLQGLLLRHEGNVTSVAAALGKPRSHVYRWLKNLGIDPRRFRREA